MEKINDVVLMARPDHSYAIYKSLLNSDLKFLYVSFKLFPRWIQKIIRDPRISFYDKYYSSSFLLTIVHILRTKFGFGRLEQYEKPLFERCARKTLQKESVKLIHYWPNYCVEAVADFKRKNKNVKTYADVYYPCELWVLDTIKPYLESQGIFSSFEDVERDAKNLEPLMSEENNFIVPSKFVLETYKKYYPGKNYIVIPYGISIWSDYKKKNHKNYSTEIRKFVYVGSVSIEKGCLLLFSVFQQLPDLELHVYGALNKNQEAILKESMKANNIFYHGVVPSVELPGIVSSYDVGIHLSLFDAYSLAVGEVMGAGLPVIVSDKTGIADLIESIHAGIITELDTEIILKSIEKIRTPETYNDYLDHLDNYIMSKPLSYGDSLVQFYKNNG